MKYAEFENNNSKRKSVIIAAIVVALTFVAIFSTLAFVNLQTKSVDNVMTSGKIDAGIDESSVDINGKAIDSFNDRRNVGQSYVLKQGQDYDKDPVIHVAPNSEPCYVYAVVNDMLATPLCDAEDSPTISEQMTANGGKTLDLAPPQDLKGTVGYKEEPIAKSSVVTNIPTFSTFSLKPGLTKEEMQTLDESIIGITGLLIQTIGFDNAKHAYRTVYGNTNPDVADDITVTFEFNGGQVVTNTTSQIVVRRGFSFDSAPEKLPALIRDGYIFDKWYADQECTIPFDTSSAIGNNTVLYAGGVKPSTPIVEFSPASPLSSIPLGQLTTIGVSAHAVSPIDGSTIIIDPSNIQVLSGGTDYVGAEMNSTTHNLELTGLAATNVPQEIRIKINATPQTVETVTKYVVNSVSVDGVLLSFTVHTAPEWVTDGGRVTYKKAGESTFVDVPETLLVPKNSNLVKRSSALFSDNPALVQALDPIVSPIVSFFSSNDSSSSDNETGAEYIYDLVDSDSNVWGTFKFSSNEGFTITEPFENPVTPVSEYMAINSVFRVPAKPLFSEDGSVYCPVFPTAETGQLAHPGIHFYDSENVIDHEITDCESMEDLAPYVCDEDGNHTLYYLFDNTPNVEPLYTFKVNDNYMDESFVDATGDGDKIPDSYVGNLMSYDDDDNPLEYGSGLSWNNVDTSSTIPPKLFGNGDKNTCIATNNRDGAYVIFPDEIDVNRVVEAYPFIYSDDYYGMSYLSTCLPNTDFGSYAGYGDMEDGGKYNKTYVDHEVFSIVMIRAFR